MKHPSSADSVAVPFCEEASRQIFRQFVISLFVQQMFAVTVQKITIFIDAVAIPVDQISLGVHQPAILIQGAARSTLDRCPERSFPQFCNSGMVPSIRSLIRLLRSDKEEARRGFPGQYTADRYWLPDVLCTWLIHNHVDHYRRIIHRGESDKGYQVLLISTGILLCCTCLTAGAVALYPWSV